MKPFTYFNMALALLATILLIAGALMIGRSDVGYWVLYSGILLAVVFSITSLIEVFQLKNISSGRKIVWVILVVSVPVVGGLLFYLIHYGGGGDVLKMPRDS